MELTIKEFGNRLKLLRQKANLSQEELAIKINTSQNIISRMEMGLGTITMALDILNVFKGMFSLDNFLADTYDLDSITLASQTEAEITPLESVAIERLILLRGEIEAELNYNIALLKGEGL